jgi:hypothetical protein
VFPLVLWRSVLAPAVRYSAAAALALWPGQILLSGVVAQDNWVLLPVAALACLAVRSALADEAHPVASGLTFGAAVAIRQENLVVLPILAVVAAGVCGSGPRKARHLASFALVVGMSLFALAALRQAATGRFALTTEHGGRALLGAFIPGSIANAWGDPYLYLAGLAPRMLEHPEELTADVSMRLVLAEVRRRPVFHVVRALSQTGNLLLDGEAQSLYWSLGPEAIPQRLSSRAETVWHAAVPLVRACQLAVLALFIAALLVAWKTRSVALLAVGSAAVLKVALHTATVVQGRYFLPVTALAIMLTAVAAPIAWRQRGRGLSQLAIGLVVAAAALLCVKPAYAWLVSKDVDLQRVYTFPLGPTSGDPAVLRCRLEGAKLIAWSIKEATLVAAVPRPDERPAPRLSGQCSRLASSAAALDLVVTSTAPVADFGVRVNGVDARAVGGADPAEYDLPMAALAVGGRVELRLAPTAAAAPRQEPPRITLQMAPARPPA